MSDRYGFPWEIEPDDVLVWTDPDGEERKVLTVGSASYNGKKGDDDCIIHIKHARGDVECLPRELSDKFRFKVVRIDETSMWSEEMQKRAGKLTGVYIYNDDEQTHCAEVTPSFWLEFIQTEPDNYPEDAEERERLLDDIQDAEARGDSSHYRHCRDVEKLSPTVLGQFESMDDAREYAQANCGSL